MILAVLAVAVFTASSDVLDWDFLTSMTHVRSARPVPGGMWCASSGGVFFYDWEEGPAAFYTYPDQLPHFEVNDVLPDGQGRLWCATAAGLALLEDGAWSVFTSFEGIPGSGEVRVVEQAGAWIWVGTDGGLARWTGEGFLPMDESITQGGFFADEVTGLSEMDDSLWIATEQGVFSLDLTASPFSASSWHHWAAETQGLDIRGFLATPDSLFAYGGEGVLRRDPGAWTVLLDYSTSADSMVLDLLSTPDGLLAACRGVRRRISGTDWESWGTGFPPGTQATFLASGDGAVWCGEGSLHWTNRDYGRGLARYDSGSWTTLPLPGLPARSCYQPASIDGRFYSGSHNRGLMARYQDDWRVFEPSDGLPNTLRVYAAVAAPGGAVWTGSYHYGLTWLRDSGTPGGDDDSLVTYVSDSIDVPPSVTQVQTPLLNNQVVCLACTGAVLWIGQEPFWSTPAEPSGVSVCTGDPALGDLEWSTFTESDGLASGSVRALVPEGASGLWIAFAGDFGCQYLDHAGTPLNHSDDSWLPGPNQAFGSSSGLPSDQVFSFCVDDDGSVLVGTGAGLSRFRPGSGFSTVPGVTGTIKAIALDGDGTAWCLGTSAIWALEGSDVTSYTGANSPFIPFNRVENEFAAFDPGSGRIVLSSSMGLWMLDTGAESQTGTGPVFYPQPFLPGGGEVLSLGGVEGGPVSVSFFSLEGAFLAAVDAPSAADWSWDGTLDGEALPSGVYVALVGTDGLTTVTKLAVVR